MTCSARLAPYLLLIGTFVPDRPLLGPLLHTQTAAMLGLYLLGFLAAIATAQLLRSTLLRHQQSVFVLELPPYRMPNVRSLALRLYDRAFVFLKNAGTVILLVSAGLWILAHVPYKDGQPAKLEDSVAGQIGHAIEPAIKPLGFNWKIGVGLITSLAAREVIVGTLGTIYGIENADKDDVNLQQALRKDLSPAGAGALLVFFAFAMQCFSTIAVVRRETGGWFWPATQFLYMSAFAYLSAWGTFVLLSR
jgi:ferrous iron transport protein B